MSTYVSPLLCVSTCASQTLMKKYTAAWQESHKSTTAALLPFNEVQVEQTLNQVTFFRKKTKVSCALCKAANIRRNEGAGRC